MEIGPKNKRRISLDDLCEEPFRLFFPSAVIAGILGVSMWPLHFSGFVSFYPGISHARLMGHGFFGGFILGFLGTALPRLLSAKRLTSYEVGLLFLLYVLMTVGHVLGRTVFGDAMLLALLLVFGSSAFVRFVRRNDLPPPGFVLVALAFASVSVGILLSLFEPDDLESASLFRITLPGLLIYQGFVLLPVLGVGAFFLPRFFGVPSAHDFPESKVPVPAWIRAAVMAAGTGLLIIGSFLIEAAGWYRVGYALRFLVAFAYLAAQIPIFRATLPGAPLGKVLKSSVVLLLAGFLLVALFPPYRIALLHLTLMGGFAMITITVATRVVFGHSGNQARLGRRNRWFTVSTVLMLIAMATRISGDFWPKILVSHYNYGALLWGAGILVWAYYVIPLVLVPDSD